MKINDQLNIFGPHINQRNRIVMPPMDTLMADNGKVTDFHIQHYGARAYGGVGTIIIESTGVMSNGRIREKDLGLWNDDQIAPMQRLVNFVHQAGAVIGAQLNHAGAKAQLNEPTIGATNLYDYIERTEFHILTKEELPQITAAFIEAAVRAKKAGLDFVELHAAHGYLLSTLINIFTNEVIKSDDILERSKMLLDIVDGINKVGIPVGIRFSIDDHEHEKGMQVEDFEPLIKALNDKVAYFHISSGEVLYRTNISNAIKEAGTKLFRLPLAEKVKQWTNKPVIVVGNFDTREDVEAALAAGIDMVAIGRELLFNPYLVINSMLTSEEMDETLYHWNNNLWFNPKKYLAFKEKMQSKK